MIELFILVNKTVKIDFCSQEQPVRKTKCWLRNYNVTFSYSGRKAAIILELNLARLWTSATFEIPDCECILETKLYLSSVSE